MIVDGLGDTAFIPQLDYSSAYIRKTIIRRWRRAMMVLMRTYQWTEDAADGHVGRALQVA